MREVVADLHIHRCASLIKFLRRMRRLVYVGAGLRGEMEAASAESLSSAGDSFRNCGGWGGAGRGYRSQCALSQRGS
jgi:hypothetical protein